MRGVSELGCAIVYGVAVGAAFPLVDAGIAERWECSADQIHRVALANLEARASKLPTTTVRGGTLSGRIIRMVDRDVAWASSLLLVADELKRLFGSEDQVFGVPGRSVLISLPLTTPSEIVAHILIDLELGQTWPLMLDPFVLMEGRLYWDTGDDGEDDDVWQDTK
ncbi:MAG: hypothetical protein WEF51_01595 [Chloroflexota bacterium]